MGFPATVVLGASGRIGSLLRAHWPGHLLPLGLQGRQKPAAYLPGENWTLFSPLIEPAALMEFIADAEVVLCLAGPVPGRAAADADMADHWRLAEALVRAAARLRDQRQGEGKAPRVLLASSAAVYGPQAGLLDESKPLLPTTAYGEAKAEMERRAKILGQALEVPVTSLRIGNIAGLDAILGGWRPGFVLDRFATGHSPRRSYIGPASLTRILAALVAVPQLPASLNLAQPGAIEMADLLRAAGHPFAMRAAPAEAIPEVLLDLSLLARCLADTEAESLLKKPATPTELCAEWAQLESFISKNHPKDYSPS